MPWVLWDIVVPLLTTFLVGLATGWLLWRWRRHKSVSPVQVVEQPAQAPVQGSATVLIEERDAALQRAEIAEQQLQQLTAENEEKADITVEATDLQRLDQSATLSPADSSVEQQAEIDELTQALNKEQAAKSELEQAFMDLNNRHKNLSHQLEESMDDENASKVRDAAGLQSRYDSSQQQLSEQKEQFEKTIDQQRQENNDLNRKLLEREAELQQLKQEKGGIENSQQTMGNDTATPQGGTVHHLSSYTPTRRAAGQGSDSAANTGSEPRGNSAADTVTSSAPAHRSATSPALNRAADADAETSSNLQTAPVLTPQEVPEEIQESQQTAVTAESANQAMQAPETPQRETPQPEAKQTESSAPGKSGRTSASKPKVKKATANGYTPTAWSVPEITPKKSERDDLQEIKGVGPVLEKLLHKTGVYYFRQVALLDKKGVEELDDQLPQFSGRIQRDKWVQQAKTLHRSKYGSAAKHD